MKVDVRKELDQRFFISLYELLKKYIEPKSEELFKEIYNTVEKICNDNDYWWKMQITDLQWKPDNEN